MVTSFSFLSVLGCKSPELTERHWCLVKCDGSSNLGDQVCSEDASRENLAVQQARWDSCRYLILWLLRSTWFLKS